MRSHKKYELPLILLLLSGLLGGCNGCYTRTYVPVQQPVVVQQPAVVQPNDYEIITGPNGVQQALVYDGTTQFLMDMAMFNYLMSGGGYGTVVNYYHNHSNLYPIYDRSRYSTWRSTRYSYSSYRPPSGYVRTTPSGYRSTPTTTYRAPSSGYRPSAPSTSSSYKSTTTSGYKPSTSSGSGYKSSYSTPSSSGYKSSSSSSSYRPSSSSGYRKH